MKKHATLEALLRSARADAPALGAKARALSRFAEARARAAAAGRGTAGALLAVVFSVLAASGISSPPDAVLVHAEACVGGIEARAACTNASMDAYGGPVASGSSSGAPGAWRGGG